MWEARATYDDGSDFEAHYPSSSKSYKEEEQERHEIEEFLISRHPGCNWYSVGWVED